MAETLTAIRLDVSIDVRLCGELGRIACVINRIRPLIHSDPIDRHGYRETQVFEINGAEVP